MTKDVFEDALIELREKQFEKKFIAQKEKMTGDKPTTVWVAIVLILATHCKY